MPPGLQNTSDAHRDLMRPCRGSAAELVRTLVIIVFLTGLLSGCASRRPEQILPVVKNGKVGYIDPRGRICVDFRYDEGESSFEGLAWVQEKGKYGAIDLEGAWVIKPRFDYAMPFFEGCAWVRVGDKWGAVDHKGTVVIALRFDHVIYGFSDGLAPVVLGEKYGYVSHDGKLAVPARYDYSGPMKAGRGRVRRGRKWGFVDRAGNEAIPLKYDLVRNFSEGLALVRIGRKVGYIDRRGVIVLPAVYASGGDFSGGIAPVMDDQRRWRYIDRNGKCVIEAPKEVDFAAAFSEGLARVRIGSQYGFIDRQGRMAIGARFGDARDFLAGLAGVCIGSPFEEPNNVRRGYIDKKGQYIWPPTR
jgi:WG repeat protein